MRDLRQVAQNLMVPAPNRSTHNVSSETLTSMKFGDLVPIYHKEVAPGTKMTLGGESLLRFQPLATPLMHNMKLKVHYFYVPFRILWHNWEYFIRGAKDPVTDLDPVIPTWSRNFLAFNTDNQTTEPLLCDYYGLQVNDNAVPYDHNAFQIAAYQMIYDNYYRHKGIEDEVFKPLVDGEMSLSDFNNVYSRMRQITYEDDYFTQALGEPQAGNPMFIDNSAPVYYNNPAGDVLLATNVGGTLLVEGEAASDIDDVPDNTLYAQMRVNAEEIRRVEALQKFVELERHAKTYKDHLLAFYGVDLPDYRAMIPQYIGGYSQPIVVSEVTNTADAQGRLSGNAATYAQSSKFDIYCPEFGMIVGIAAVTYDSLYVDAQAKIHNKKDRFDFLVPEFDNLGDQPLTLGELISGVDNPDEPWAYVPRYSDYRTDFNRCTGEMKLNLMHWHLGRNYGAGITLNKDFFTVIDERRPFVYQNVATHPIIIRAYTDAKAGLPIGAMNSPTI